MFMPQVPQTKVSTQDVPWDDFTITDFSGGLCTKWPKSNIRDNQFVMLNNFLFEQDGSLKARGPYRPYNAKSGQDTEITGTPYSFRLIRMSGTERLLSHTASGSNVISAYWNTSEDPDEWTAIKSDWTANYLVQTVKFTINDAEDAILCNGADAPQRWSGTGTATALGLTTPWAIPNLGDSAETIDNAAAVDNGDETTVGIPIAGHSFTTNDVVTISGTTNYDGSYQVESVTASHINITAAYVEEMFAGTESVTSPSSATANLSAAEGATNGRGLTKSGTYYYKFTYFYDDSGTTTKYGESGPSGAIDVEVSGATDSNPMKVTFSNLPAIPSGVSKVYVYRSGINEEESSYYRVGEYTSGTTFTDYCPYGEEGDICPIDAGTPSSFDNPCVFAGRLWVKSGTLNTKLEYSALNQPDYFPAVNFVYFPDELIGCVPFKENLYIFTVKAIYVIPDGDVASYPNPLKVSDRGCSSFRSIADVGNGLVFQGDDNIYWVDFNTRNRDGDFPIPIGDPIQDKIQRIPKTPHDGRTGSVGVLHGDRYYLCFYDAGTIATAATPPPGYIYFLNNATLVWDVRHGTRMLKQGLMGGWSQVDWSGNDLQDFEGILYSVDTTNGYVREHDYTGADDYATYALYDAATGSEIRCSLTTKLLHLGHEWHEKLFHAVSLACETSGVTFSVNLYLNNKEYNRPLTMQHGDQSLTTVTDPLIWDHSTWAVHDTIDNDDAVDKGGGQVGIPITGHSLSADDTITIYNTTNYNGTYTVDSETADEIVITATYVAETFAGTEPVVNHDSTSYRWASDTYDFYLRHARWPRGAKGRNCQIGLSCTDAQDTHITFLKLYYRLTQVAI